MRLGFLQSVYEQPGPFATVYLDTSGDAEDAGKAIQLRWRSAREQLAAAGADEAILRSIDADLEESQARTGHRGEVIVANSEGVVLSDELPQRPGDLSDDETTHFGPVPALFPYLRMRGARIPHVIAIVDTLVHKSGTAGGAGSEQTQQNAVEESWKHNAGQAADEISKRAAASGAEVIVLAGDPQQRTLVLEDVRKGMQPLVVETEASHRDRKASDESLQREISETIDSVIASRVTDVVHDFERERGEGSRATEGWESTVAALQHGQVETLLRVVPDSSERPAELHVGRDGADIALEASGLGEGAEPAPADSALVRALAGTSASLVLVEPGQVDLQDGIGAVLRYSES